MKRKQTSAQAQQSWLRIFEELVTKERPELKGRIEWDSAKHFMYQRMTTREAADKYLEARKENS